MMATPSAGNALEQLALADRDALETAETFQVCCARIGDDADRWFSDTRQVRDLTLVIGTHLDDRITMRPVQFRAASTARRCDC